MKLPALLSKEPRALPGVTGIARVDRRRGDVLRRSGPGDIVLLDALDLDRRTADLLVNAEVAGVVNASPSISGRYPNLGPEVLVGAGIPLIDGVGAEILRTVKDGTKLRLHEGRVYAGERELAQGTDQTPESVADAMIDAKAGMSTQLEAFSANTMEFLHRERTLVLDGVGVPELKVPMRGREVLVVAGGRGHAEDLAALKRYIADHRPVLLGVDGGADTLLEAGYPPDVVVGDPQGIGTPTLKASTDVVIPAQSDGHAPGLARIQDLGVGAVTFPSTGNPEDLALLLAEAHGASLVVTVGFHATLQEFLDRGRSGSNPSTFLTRLKLGSKIVDGKAVATLHRSRVSGGAVALLLLAVVLVLLVALLWTDVGRVYLGWFGDVFGRLLTWVKGLFS